MAPPRVKVIGSKWIDVLNELPKDGIYVIVHTDYQDGRETEGLYLDGGWFITEGAGPIQVNVTHWQPFPRWPF